jgi:hypothetical protein
VEIVAERGREAREARLPPELRRRVRHCQRGGGLSAAAASEERGAVVYWCGAEQKGEFQRRRGALWLSSGPGLEFSFFGGRRWA